MPSTHGFNISNLYIGLWCLYLLQDVLYPGGSPISLCIIAICLGWSIYMAIRSFKQNKYPPYIMGLILLVGMFTAYGGIHILSGAKDYVFDADVYAAPYSYLLLIFLSLLPIFSFYLFSLESKLTIQNLQYWTLIFMLIALADFVTGSMLFGGDSILSNESTSNKGYLFAAITPLAVFFKKKTVLFYSIIAFCVCFSVLSMKRGAMLIAIISACLILYFRLKESKGWHKTFLVIFITCLLLAAGVGAVYLFNTNVYFQERIYSTLEGNSSHRDILYAEIVDHWLHSASTLEFLFGGGANHTLVITTNYAHNDWFEIMANQGLFGLLVYCLYWIPFVYTYFKLKSYGKSDQAQCLGVILVSTFCMTLFSMSYNALNIFYTAPLGLCVAEYTKCNNTIECK